MLRTKVNRDQKMRSGVLPEQFFWGQSSVRVKRLGLSAGAFLSLSGHDSVASTESAILDRLTNAKTRTARQRPTANLSNR
jgi:hypothetical protein